MTRGARGSAPARGAARRAALAGGARAAVALAALLGAALPGCHCADGLGPLERGARQAVGGWDMWSTPSVRPYETPMPLTVAGTVPTSGTPSYAEAHRRVAAMAPADRDRRARQSYRRYCAHCHGARGDGRSIVGESFDPAPTDLRTPDLQEIDDETLWSIVTNGSGRMLPLAPIMTPEEIALALQEVRRLRQAPSRPYFTPKYTEPIQ